ncbi:helix-turn-helix transcriptional regulator [Agrobacterium larrymoorei]|uniref:LuxR family transcriptional regulator n=1 Tax=Agrobacterium larrymoorei TaxID=160699 RepID=A0ABU0UQU4_9HYPH|nr:LuxR family transcriptional regulator [Agrobacterium larrymoorei]MDQ1187329.1 LuxR family transcriptional regulator [Agrobacterium larrymoorei]
MQTLFTFMDTHAEPSGLDEFLSFFQRVISHYGFDYYRIFRRAVRRLAVKDVVLAEQQPEGWSAVYDAKKYSEVDPIERSLCLLQKPIRWRDSACLLSQATHRKRAAKLFQDAARHGIREGYAFPIHGRNGMLGGIFIGGLGCHLTETELAIFDAVMRATFWRVADFTGHSEDLLALPDMSVAQLTRRERDVLVLLALGNTSPEIGKALSISCHTADWYLSGIQRKLGARNRQHVVALAFRYGLIG